MSAISIGRIVTKTMGREAGKRAVVTQLIDNKFVEISNPLEGNKVKRRRVNISHIEPTPLTVEISKDNNSDDNILSAIEGNAELKDALEIKL